jgi:tRNA (uracil-5-)-methyltransferase
VFPWLDQKGAINIQDCIASPSIYEYRNKVEFTFGYLAPQPKLDSESAVVEKDNTKKVACVGMLASGWKGGISKPHGCSNTPSEACGVADVFNKFLKNCPMPPYDNWTHTGVWRQVTIRMSRRTNQCMLIIQHAPPTGAAGSKTDGSEDHTAVFESESKRLVRMLTKHSIRLPSAESRAMPADAASEAKTDMRVTSIYFQEYDGLSTPSPAHPVQHKYGSLCMEEKLGKCTFEISPGAFFQVNTPGAELLYGVVVEKLRELQPEKSSGEKHKTLLFDVCCGTGTIGLTCLKEGVADQVVGVDISEPAIADAVNNAKKNGIDAGETSGEDDTQMTTRFIASRAEAVLTKELSKARANKDVTTHIVAVVDPARDGLHPVVVRALGAQEDIKRIVYVSCNPVGTLVRDAAMLCAPPTKKYSGLPFKITSAQPVDMFPLTPHCEMVMTFDRMTQEEYNACLEEKPVEEAK